MILEKPILWNLNTQNKIRRVGIFTCEKTSQPFVRTVSSDKRVNPHLGDITLSSNNAQSNKLYSVSRTYNTPTVFPTNLFYDISHDYT